jgi:alkaline phosphatase D
MSRRGPATLTRAAGPQRHRARPPAPPFRAAHALALGVSALVAATAGADAGLLVTVGDVGDRVAVVWVRAPAPGRVTLSVGPSDRRQGRLQLTGQATPARDLTVKLRAEGLIPATRHAYRVEAAGEAVEGEFVTAPEAGATRPLTLVWSGDLGGGGRCRSPGSGYPIFRAMAERRPDVFFFVGDTIYADHRCGGPANVPGADFRAVDLPGFRAKHRYNRADAAVQGFFRSTAVWAIWDDHEVRNDFAGPTEPLMPTGRRAFLDYWPIQPPPDDPFRLYRRFRWGRLVEGFILDTRQYRSANELPDGPDKTMLGEAQRQWLLAGLRGSDAVWKLVVSSVSLSIPTGRVVRDSWANGSTRFAPGGTPTGFEHELLGIVAELAAARVRNVIWLVTDVHRAEAIRHAPQPGLVFHELVAGPLSASLGRPGVLDDTLRPSRLFGEGGYYNFGELRVTADGLEVRIIDVDGRVRFETTLAPER